MLRLPPFNNSTIPPHPRRQIAGAGLALIVTLGLVGALLAILAAGGVGTAPHGGAILALVGLTTLQAGLSTLVSIAVGMALAWALNRLRFFGRGVVIALLSAAIVTPGIVVAFGLISVWGRAGFIADALTALTGTRPDFSIFGLGGIIFAHTILDGAFAARVLLARLDALPPARLKLGQSLGLRAVERFLVLDWPALRGALPGLAAVIFLLAFTSFPIVLMLGGGPANQTIEVAIYAAVRLDFDLGRAVLLALVQIGFCALIVSVSALLRPASLPTAPSQPSRWRDSRPARLGAVLVLLGLGFALLSPLVAVLVEGIPALPVLLTRPTLAPALLASLAIASLSSLLAVALGLIAALARASATRPLVRLLLGAPLLGYLAVPAMVLALGAFLLVRNAGLDPERAAPFVLILANALLVLPFALATLGPPLDMLAQSRGRLLRSLRLSGTVQFFAVELPLIRADLALVLALGFCFSLGDLGIIALFGTDQFATLPLMMMRALGAYRSADAAALAALMLLISGTVFTVLPRLIAKVPDARA
jgi:thiamine transport system permease protein